MRVIKREDSKENYYIGAFQDLTLIKENEESINYLKNTIH